MTREEVRKALKDYFKENESDFNDAIESLDSYTGYLGDNRYYDMAELDEFFCDSDPTEILNRAFFGYCEDYTDKDGRHTEAFNPNQEYFTFNGYGNLVSTDFKDYTAFLDDYFCDELIDDRHGVYVCEEVAEILDALDE